MIGHDAEALDLLQQARDQLAAEKDPAPRVSVLIALGWAQYLAGRPEEAVIRENAPALLGNLFRPEDYPDPDEMHKLFSIEVSYEPVPEAGNFFAPAEGCLAWLESLPSRYGIERFIFACTELHLLLEPISRGSGALQTSRIVDPLLSLARDFQNIG